MAVVLAPASHASLAARRSVRDAIVPDHSQASCFGAPATRSCTFTCAVSETSASTKSPQQRSAKTGYSHRMQRGTLELLAKDGMFQGAFTSRAIIASLPDMLLTQLGTEVLGVSSPRGREETPSNARAALASCDCCLRRAISKAATTTAIRSSRPAAAQPAVSMMGHQLQ